MTKHDLYEPLHQNQQDCQPPNISDYEYHRQLSEQDPYEHPPQNQRNHRPLNMRAYEYQHQQSGKQREKVNHVETLPPDIVRLPTADEEVKSIPHLKKPEPGSPNEVDADNNDDILLQQLKAFNIKSVNWEVYTNAPNLWEFKETDEFGLDVDTKIIMLETKPVFPNWVKEE